MTWDAVKSHIARYVHETQKHMSYGGQGASWEEVEADEVTLGKTVLNKQKVSWLNFLGLVARGWPDSLAIFKLSTRTTARRAPGPGPILRSQWLPIARRYLSGRGIILHTDSARAYEAVLPKVVRSRARSLVYCVAT